MTDQEEKTTRLKASAYNYSSGLPDGTRLFFNFYTLNLLALDPDKASLARVILVDPDKAPFDTPAREVRTVLAEKGFLIPMAVDERELLRDERARSRTQGQHLSLTILPTLACNFRCTYCYETHRGDTMGPEVEEALVAFVEQRLGQGESMSVTWFGGEPLLAMDCIQRLTDQFLGICAKKDAGYTAHVVTNGYLLDEACADRLAACRLTRAQVTLDGPPEVHNRRRPLADGRGSFERILANLKAVAGKFTLNLRINVDEDNRHRIGDLLDLLEAEGLRGRVIPYLGRAYPYTEVCADVAGTCLSDTDFALLELETEMELIRRGLGGYRVIRGRSTNCVADKPNAFVITPSGGIVNCWNHVADPGAEIGHLLKPLDQQMQANVHRWEALDPLKLQCADCLFLPVCMGGCPYHYLTRGELDCHHWKHHPDESLAFYHYVKCREQEDEILRHFHQAVEEVKELAGDPVCGPG